jgi:hypothetical protein
MNADADSPLFYIAIGNIATGKTQGINQLISLLTESNQLNYGLVFSGNNNVCEEKLEEFTKELEKNNELKPYLVIDVNDKVNWFIPQLQHLLMNRERYKLYVCIGVISTDDVAPYVVSMCNGLMKF